MDKKEIIAVWEKYLEVTEKKLSPKQKELDVDGDGDIEGDDLAALRAKKKGQKAEAKMKCPKCDGKGCDHCNDTGYHTQDESSCGKMRKEETEILSIRHALKIMAERAVKAADKAHTKGATKPEEIMDKESPKSKEFAAQSTDKDGEPHKDFDEKGHDDMEKAGRAVKSQAPARKGDNLNNGDSKSPEKVKDNS
jgi:hypothetical protein